jgi:hypothetical protein
MQGLGRCLLVALLLLCSLSSSLPKVQGIAEEEKSCGPNCALITTDGTDSTAPPFFLQALQNDSINEIVLTAPRYQASCRSIWRSWVEIAQVFNLIGCLQAAIS